MMAAADETPKSGKILTTQDQIKDYMGIKDALYQYFLKMKMPVVIINNRHYAHADNIDNWWQQVTEKPKRLELDFDSKK